MMRFLIFDILNQNILFSNGVCKRPIAILPAIKLRKQRILFYVLRTRKLYILNNGRQRNSWMQVHQDVDVIFYATDPIQMAVFIF